MREYRILVILLVVALCLAVMPAGFAAEAPETIEYAGGGIVSRFAANANARALISELDVAYMELEGSFLTLNEPAQWTVHAAGGDGNYNYAFHLYYRTDKSSNTFYYVSGQSQAASSNNVYTATPNVENAQYVVLLTISDTSGNSITYQSQVFEMASEADYADETTVAGKVEALVSQCLREAGGNDYARALWFHDWLIYNANYDYTYTNYYADGVLLKGTGVCQSYTLAYEMLLKRVGIECIYISSDSMNHSWNMIKLGDEWYHVDCTWDDPNTGGRERHDYFCLSDEMMARDHEWVSKWSYLPECTSIAYNYSVHGGAYVITDHASLKAAFDDAVENRRPYAEFAYTGGDAEYSLSSEIETLLENTDDAALTGYGIYGSNAFNVTVAFSYGDGFANLTQPERLFFAEEEFTLEVGESAYLDLDYSPKRYIATTENSDGSVSAAWKTLAWEDFEITWSSTNLAAVSVESGKITANANGSSVITASCGDVSASCMVQVEGGIVIASSVVIPDGVTAIAEEAFLNCSTMLEIVIPAGTATSIGSRAFVGCDALIQVVIPADVTSIAEDAFEGNTWTTIICERGSAAHEFAMENNMNYSFK